MSRAAPIMAACLLLAATAAAESVVYELPAELGSHTHVLPVSGVIVDAATLGLDCEAEYAVLECASGSTIFWRYGYWCVRLDVELAGQRTVETWQPLAGAHSHDFSLIAAGQGGMPLDDGRITITLTAMLNGVVTTPDILCEVARAGALGLVPTLRLYLAYHDGLPAESLLWGALKTTYF